MLSPKMEQALNDQINAEFFSAYLYLSMSAYFVATNFDGFANWMRIQYEEETQHALKIYDYINDRRGTVVLQAIEKPQTEWDSPLEVFEASFKHEQFVTGRINALVALAREEKDPATESFLKWFVDEQVEEETSVDAVVQDMKRVQDFPAGMFLLDRELGQRQAEASAGGADAT